MGRDNDDVSDASSDLSEGWAAEELRIPLQSSSKKKKNGTTTKSSKKNKDDTKLSKREWLAKVARDELKKKGIKDENNSSSSEDDDEDDDNDNDDDDNDNNGHGDNGDNNDDNDEWLEKVQLPEIAENKTKKQLEGENNTSTNYDKVKNAGEPMIIVDITKIDSNIHNEFDKNSVNDTTAASALRKKIEANYETWANNKSLVADGTIIPVGSSVWKEALIQLRNDNYGHYFVPIFPPSPPPPPPPIPTTSNSNNGQRKFPSSPPPPVPTSSNSSSTHRKFPASPPPPSPTARSPPSSSSKIKKERKKR